METVFFRRNHDPVPQQVVIRCHLRHGLRKLSIGQAGEFVDLHLVSLLVSDCHSALLVGFSLQEMGIVRHKLMGISLGRVCRAHKSQNASAFVFLSVVCGLTRLVESE